MTIVNERSENMSYSIKNTSLTFATRDDAMKYLGDKFLIENEEENLTSEIVNRIKEVVPKNVSVSAHQLSENQYKAIVQNADLEIESYLNPEGWGGDFNTITDLV